MTVLFWGKKSPCIKTCSIKDLKCSLYVLMSNGEEKREIDLNNIMLFSFYGRKI
jgi:hypothetical protein